MKINARVLIFVITAFTLISVTTDFFINMNSVLAQTIFGLSKIGFILIFLYSINVTNIEYKFLKICLYSYWIGTAHLYLINALIYQDFNKWVRNFNDYSIMIFIFTFSTLGAIIYAWRKLG